MHIDHVQIAIEGNYLFEMLAWTLPEKSQKQREKGGGEFGPWVFKEGTWEAWGLDQKAKKSGCPDY